MIVTREDWLNRLVTLLTPMFEEAGHKLPTNVRVSCGWPCKNALPSKRQRIGECFYSESSADKHFEIFISPVLGDAVRAADVLVHELIHAVLPKGVKHGPQFAKLATKLGLEGKPTATIAGAVLAGTLKTMVDTLGPYPHAELRPMVEKKPQKNRMFKVTCEECGYVARVARKWLEVGTPLCPSHPDKAMVREDADEEVEDGE